MQGDPHDLSAEERQQRGIERLPETLGQAVQALAEDTFFIDILGPVFIEEYLALKRFAWSQYINHVSSWEVQNYAEAF